MNKEITVKIKSVYGNELMYIESEHKEFISNLTGKKTVARTDLNNLEQLGFSIKFI